MDKRDEDDEARIDLALRALGQKLTLRTPSYERLAGGLSGSAVWRFDLAGRSVVLKVTDPADTPVLERARRENRFHRDLAARVPIRTPMVIAQLADERHGALLLMQAEAPAPPLGAWSTDDFHQVAADLGHLHARFSGDDQSDLPPWLPEAMEVSIEELALAISQWTAFELPEAVIDLREAIVRLVNRVPELDQRWDRPPNTLCHGDAHRDNLLIAEDGTWIWVDWQGVRWGQGLDDLTFFWQRAFAETPAIPPMEDLLPTYRDLWLRVGVQVPEMDALADAATWSELRSWLVAWPPYLGWLPPQDRVRVLRRIDVLARRLGIAPNGYHESGFSRGQLSKGGRGAEDMSLTNWGALAPRPLLPKDPHTP